MLKTIKKYKMPYLFILPFFVLFLVFQLIPIIWTVYISFTQWRGIGDPQFIGWDNYKKILIDNMFWEALKNTVVYWISGLVLILIFALLIATILNSDLLKGRVFFKTVTFLPNVCAAIAMGLIFRLFFDENAGLINEALQAFGLSRVPWLTSTQFSKIPVIILNVWRNTPWFTMIILSGLLNIPRDYYEAATMDGAGKWKQFCYITLPSLGNILFFCSVTLTVDSWKLFNESYILPGPGTSNTSLFQYMYASSIGVVLIVILAIISVIQLAVRRRQGEI